MEKTDFRITNYTVVIQITGRKVVKRKIPEILQILSTFIKLPKTALNLRTIKPVTYYISVKTRVLRQGRD